MDSITSTHSPTTSKNNHNNTINSNIDDDNNQCPICLSPMTNTTSVVGCEHTFCFECIDNWIKNKIACPLCKIDIKQLLVENDNRIIEVTPPPKPHPSTVEADLGCLDHTYFLEELIKLFRLSESVGFMIENAPPLKQNSNSKVYVSGTNQSDAFALLTITDNMTRLRDDLSQLEPFDPQDMLSHIYTIETSLNQLKTFYTNHNNFKTNLSHNQSVGGSSGNTYSSPSASRYNDYYYDDDDDDYDGQYDDDEQRYLDEIEGARRHNKSAYESPSMKKASSSSGGGKEGGNSKKDRR